MFEAQQQYHPFAVLTLCECVCACVFVSWSCILGSTFSKLFEPVCTCLKNRKEAVRFTLYTLIQWIKICAKIITIVIILTNVYKKSQQWLNQIKTSWRLCEGKTFFLKKVWKLCSSKWPAGDDYTSVSKQRHFLGYIWTICCPCGG